MSEGGSPGEPDITSAAALLANPSRAAILSALTDGRALPAGEIARIAGVPPGTASIHIASLLEGKLLRVEAQCRHRYFRLSDYVGADLLESLALVASRPAPPARTDALALGRTCYGHLAGRLGVSIANALQAKQLIDSDFMLTDAGRAWFSNIGIEIDSLKRTPLSRPCLDWSERRHHLAGALGVALATRLFELKWVARGTENRVVSITPEGREALPSTFGLAS